VTNTQSWDRVASQRSGASPTDIVQYGPEGPTEDDVRLLGNVAGKRILDLGCGDGQAAVAFTLRGATTIAVDSSVRMLDRARTLAEQAGVRVEWHQGDVADLAFVRAESIDIVFSAYSLGEVGDLHRVFRQVHRVLKNRGAFVFSYEHPIDLCVGRAPPDTPATPINRVVRMPYFTDDPVTVERDGQPIRLYVRTVSEVFYALTRGGFRVEVLAEPRPLTSDALVPHTIIWRGRKEGL
jgi:ubiquinone/menaquinone biosynthesis C-methylase UbiE